MCWKMGQLRTQTGKPLIKIANNMIIKSEVLDLRRIQICQSMGKLV